MRRFRIVCLALAVGASPLSAIAASITSVTTAGDAGTGSTCTLRQAIVAMNTQTVAGTSCVFVASAADRINFDTATFPDGAANTILLADVAAGMLQLTRPNLTIDASANGGVTIARPTGATFSYGILNVNAAGTLTLRNLTIRNGAADNGAGINLANTNLALVNCTLSGNAAGDRGGGIYVGFGSLTATNSTFIDNASVRDGGGVYGNQSGITVTNSTFSGNSAPGDPALGGNGSGGGISSQRDVYVTGSTFNANSANYGGGVNVGTGSRLTNSTFTGNGATFGGAIKATNSLRLINTTVVGNSAFSYGGIDASNSFDLTNSIIAGNGGGNFYAPFFGGGSETIVGGDPLLAPLADNGGPTQTMLPLPGSPAIDYTICQFAPATDQRGTARPQGGACDAGAVEIAQPARLTVDTTVDAQVQDGKCSLREAVVIFAQGRAVGALDCPPAPSTYNDLRFAPTLAVQSVTVASPLTLGNNVELTIDGTGASGVQIDGGNATFIFDVLAGSTVTIQHVGIGNGSSAGSEGGAIDNAGTLTLFDTTLSNNTGTSGGGAITNTGTLTIRESTLANNFTAGPGGAILVESGVVTMTGSAVVDNLAATGGGVSVATDGTLNLTGSTLSTNRALATSGGGVAANGRFIIANSTFAGNIAGTDGGAIYNNKAANANRIVNSTIVGNTAVNGGNLANAAGTLLVQNSIVANSAGGTNCQGVIVPGTGFLTWPAGDATCGALIVANPMLGSLANNGGRGLTMLLGAGSAALDAGNAATCAAAPVSNRDQRGALRPQGAGCEIGALEVGADPVFRHGFEDPLTP